ncbi:MAG: adenine phosphoribosyltransferase [Polyangiaceae bacterium]|nr:adenine phosphoribosyltransferase [Polyangiaceae bacterium]
MAQKKQPRTPPRPSPTPRGVSREVLQKSKARGEQTPDAYLRARVREVPDFPRPGILFKDIVPLLTDPKAFHMVLDGLAHPFIGEHIDAVAGIEARGFIFGGALAARLNASFVPLRKPGKLPGETDRVSYSLEYGTNELEVQEDSFESGAKVIIVDDLLATGGTAAAAAELVRRQGGYVAAYAFVVELDALKGRRKLSPTPIVSLLRY